MKSCTEKDRMGFPHMSRHSQEVVTCCAGIIVLPCGAGKSLVGITAASRIKKSVLCLVTNSVSVDQWKHQFQLWTNLQDHQISRRALSLIRHNQKYADLYPVLQRGIILWNQCLTNTYTLRTDSHQTRKG